MKAGPRTLVACAAVGFLLVLAATGTHTSTAGARLPASGRLADLIAVQTRNADALRVEVDDARRQVDAARRQAEAEPGASDQGLTAAQAAAGVDARHGPGLRVTLDDAPRRAGSPVPGGADVTTANLDDLVIHSQDVQAVVNAVWRSGATAVAVNGQRLVSTSAVLCVGNTLLLNGTVHAPPFVVTALDADRDRFDGEPLVGRLKHDADQFGLGFKVERETRLDVPAYAGTTSPRYAAAAP